MRVLILAGGKGTRFGSECELTPKPLIKIGPEPILWHIMKIYRCYGILHFEVLCGYLMGKISSYWKQPSLTRNLISANIVLHDTGIDTMTGGRIKQAGPTETFMVTYGDGVADINIPKLLAFHRSHGKLCTVTAVQPQNRFGCIDIDDTGKVNTFKEKDKDTSWINGGFFVCEPEVLDYIAGDSTAFEKEPLENLAKDGQLYAYKHEGFWQCMDNAKERDLLNKLWESGNAPWKVWE